MNISIAVLLTCHNRREKTISCLRALFQSILSEGQIFDVFLVDDGSIDHTSEAVMSEFPQVNLIKENGNLYWNRGMFTAWNHAARKKDYDYFLWLNDDTLLVENALGQMLEYIQTVKNNRIVVGATCSKDSGKATYGGFNFSGKKLIPDGTWQDCDYFNGNIVLIPSLIFKKVGMLDKRFRHALGDFDYGMRATKMGFIHSLSPHYLGYCEEHESDPAWRNRSVSVFKRLKLLYTPLGNDPIEFFVYDRRHNGLLPAFMHFFSIHLRTIFPFLWKS